LIEVSPEVFAGFDADTEAEERGGEVFLAWDSGAALDGGFDGSEAGGVADEAQAEADIFGGLGISVNIEGNDGAETFELPAGGFVCRVRGQTWVSGSGDGRVRFQPGGEDSGAFLCPLQTDRKSANASNREKIFESSGCGAGQFTGVAEG
jgi:hypothetical protein